MSNMLRYEIIYKYDTFDIMSADTDFYAFMSDERLYYSFDRLVDKEDIALLKKYMDEDYKEHFMLRLVSGDGTSVLNAARFYEIEKHNKCKLVLMPVLEAIDNTIALNNKILRRNNILELYGDNYFEYECQTDVVSIFTIHKFEQNIAECSLADFEKMMSSKASEENFKKVEQIIQNMKHGNGYFSYYMNQNFFSNDPECTCTEIRMFSLSEQYSCGYLHTGKAGMISDVKLFELDPLTGVLNKSEITNAATKLIDDSNVAGTAIAIVDVDYFKNVNDTYGHKKGDEVLKTIASIMEGEVDSNGLVGRIGGDEFFIVFFNIEDMENAREHIRSIKNKVNSVFQKADGSSLVTVSIGCSAYPKDADNYDDLFTLADFALYRAKEKGRNRYIIYDADKHGSLEEIKNRDISGLGISERGKLSLGEILCIIMDRVKNKDNYTLTELLDDIILQFGIQRIVIYSGEDNKVFLSKGEENVEIPAGNQYLSDSDYKNCFDSKGCLVVNNISFLENKAKKAYDNMQKQGIKSFIQFRVFDKDATPVIISLESISKRTVWNQSHMHFYRLIAELICSYSLS